MKEPTRSISIGVVLDEGHKIQYSSRQKPSSAATSIAPVHLLIMFPLALHAWGSSGDRDIRNACVVMSDQATGFWPAAT